MAVMMDRRDAERLLGLLPGPRFYMATMQVYDDEGRAKVARHRRMRAGKGFVTVEAQTDVDRVDVPAEGSVLLECIANLVSNEMFDRDGTMHDAAGKVIAEVGALAGRCANLVVITNDVGSELASGYGEGTRAYIEAIGRVNATLARRADHVYELVCGIPVVLKGSLPPTTLDGGSAGQGAGGRP